MTMHIPVSPELSMKAAMVPVRSIDCYSIGLSEVQRTLSHFP